jgi:hypothetical protein
LVYHNRNRTLSPTLGRFLQSDPNASGVGLVSSVPHSGLRVLVDVMSVDLGQMAGDGVNLYQYCQGNPVGGSDPTGLYSDEDEMEGEEWDPSNPVEDFTDFLGAIMNPSGAANAMLEELVTDYIVRLDDDLDWAMDWSRRDDDYSRRENKWVDASLARGAGNHFQIDKMRKYFDGGEGQDGPAMASTRGGGGGGSSLGRLWGHTRGLEAGVCRMTYNLNRKAFKNVRKEYWRKAMKAGTYFKEFDWTPANKALVANGRSPLDRNGIVVHLHHKIPLRCVGGTNDFSNLQPVLAKVHRRFHRRWPRRRRRSVNGHRERCRVCKA